MFAFTRLSRHARSFRYALVAAVAFSLGSATVVAARNPEVIGSLFFIPMLNGVATTPCNSETEKGLVTTTCTAVVDSKGQLSVSDSDTHKSLNQLQFDSGGNLKTAGQGTSNISGTVSVSNFPATQNVNITGGTVNSGRVILLATAFTAPDSSFNATQAVDTSDCKSLVGLARFSGSASDIDMQLSMENPDGSGFGAMNGTLLGIGRFFTVGGTPVTVPRAGLSVKSNTGQPLTLDKVWLYCGR